MYSNSVVSQILSEQFYPVLSFLYYLCMMEDLSELKDLILHAVPSHGKEVLTGIDNEEALLLWLTGKIEQLIAHDFEGLLFLLYRIDVSEQKVRQMLAETKGEGAALTMATLIMERQKQKLKLRRQMGKFPSSTDDPERW